MIKTLEEALMLEIADEVVVGDEVDAIVGADTTVDPTDFDPEDEDEQLLAAVDLLSAPVDRKAED